MSGTVLMFPRATPSVMCGPLGGQVLIRHMQQALDYVWRLFIRVRLHQVFGLVQFYLLHFELAEVEPCNWLPSALPYTYTLAAFVLLTHQVSGCGNLHILRDAKRHVVAGVLA